MFKTIPFFISIIQAILRSIMKGNGEETYALGTIGSFPFQQVYEQVRRLRRKRRQRKVARGTISPNSVMNRQSKGNSSREFSLHFR